MTGWEFGADDGIHTGSGFAYCTELWENAAAELDDLLISAIQESEDLDVRTQLSIAEEDLAHLAHDAQFCKIVCGRRIFLRRVESFEPTPMAFG